MADTLKRTVIIELEVDDNGAVTGMKNVENQIKKTGDETKKAAEQTGDYSSAMGALDGAMGGVAGKAKGLLAGVKGLTAGFKGLRGAIIATGLGALLITITSLVSYFQRSREGTEKLNKIMAVLGSTMDVVLDTMSGLGKIIFGLFSGDGESVKAIKEFGGIIFDTIGLPIKNVIDTIKALGNAVSALLGGEGLDAAFAELEKGAFEIGQNYKEAGDAIVGVYDSVKDKITEVIEEGAEANKLADRQNQLERDRLAFKEREADIQRQIGNARLETENLELSAQERLEQNQKAQALINQLAQERIALQKEQVSIIEGQQALGLTDIAGEEELIALKVEIINLETQRDSQLRSVLTKEKSITAEVQKQNELRSNQEEIDAQRARGTELTLSSQAQREVQLTTDTEKAKVDIVKKSTLTIAEAYKTLYEGIDDVSKKSGKEQVQVGLQVAGAALSLSQTLFGETKAGAIAQGVINTASAVIQALPNPILAAIAAAAGAAQLIKIAATPPPPKPTLPAAPTFARGGMLYGKLHSQGGIMAELESGEAVLNRRTMANPLFRSIASMMNEAGGGVKFARGGMLGTSEATAIMQEAMSFNKNSQFIPVLVTEDLNTVENRVAVTEQISTL